MSRTKFPKNLIERAMTCIDNLEQQRKDSVHALGQTQLDTIKKNIVAYLAEFTDIYSRIQVFKGPNHTFCEEELKALKSETLRRLKDQNLVASTADAERLYPSDPVYQQQLAELRLEIQYFLKVESVYKFYVNIVFQSIFQSISVAGKEKMQSDFGS